MWGPVATLHRGPLPGALAVTAHSGWLFVIHWLASTNGGHD